VHLHNKSLVQAEDTYFQANNWASYDDWRRARDQWDYFCKFLNFVFMLRTHSSCSFVLNILVHSFAMFPVSTHFDFCAVHVVQTFSISCTIMQIMHFKMHVCAAQRLVLPLVQILATALKSLIVSRLVWCFLVLSRH
jgi:hypothetical protein